MAMALHVAADHRAVEDFSPANSLVVPCNRASWLRRGPSSAAIPAAVERLSLALFVDRQDDSVGGRIDVETHDLSPFVDKARGRWTA
jgi:hypothetical protein